MDDCYQAAPGVVWRALDDGLILLDTRRGHYFELNASGRRWFELICAGQTLDEAVGHLQHNYTVDPATLQVDMRKLCADLLAAGVIVKTEPAIDGPG